MILDREIGESKVEVGSLYWPINVCISVGDELVVTLKPKSLHLAYTNQCAYCLSFVSVIHLAARQADS